MLYTTLGIETPSKWMTKLWWELLKTQQQSTAFLSIRTKHFCFDWRSLQNYLRWLAKLLPNTMKLTNLQFCSPGKSSRGLKQGYLFCHALSFTHKHQGPTTLWSVPFRHNYYFFELVFSHLCNTENTCFWEFKQPLHPLWKEVFYSVAVLEIIWIKKKRLIAHVKVPLKKTC